MITDAILAIGYFLISGFTYILPASDGLPAGFETSLNSLFETAFDFNSVLPIDTLLAVLIALVTFEVGVMLFKLTRWAFASVPFSSIKHK